jgi:serine/threonine protein kinase
MMNELDQEHIVRFITAFRRLNKIGEEHYVMFEWAGGGNLRRMWKATPSPELTGNLVKLVVEQLLGLATALSAAHNLQSPGSSGASYRHGDLKPENILVFPNDNPVGTLKIGDWGEAKYQGKVTAIRPSRTTTKFGTRRYEAPEVEIGLKTAWLGQSERRRSRLGDIWAMGCITLEFIVWLLYGLKGLEKFNNDVFGETFYQVSIVNGKKAAQVHVAVVRWMERISKEPACAVGTTALGDLLEFVQTQLLVVNLPPRLGQTFDVNLERQRTNSFDDPCSAQTSSTFQPPEIETLTIFEEPAVANNPTFTLTPAETNGSTNDDRTPIPSEPGTNGPTRCHAVVFKDKLYDIITTEDSNYWDTKQLLQGPLDLAYADDELSLTETIQSSDEYKRVSLHAYCTISFSDTQYRAITLPLSLTTTNGSFRLTITRLSECSPPFRIFRKADQVPGVHQHFAMPAKTFVLNFGWQVSSNLTRLQIYVCARAPAAVRYANSFGKSVRVANLKIRLLHDLNAIVHS